MVPLYVLTCLKIVSGYSKVAPKILSCKLNILQPYVKTKLHRPSNSHGLTVTLTVWDAISRSHGFAFKSHGEPKTSKLPKKILHRLENMKE